MQEYGQEGEEGGEEGYEGEDGEQKFYDENGNEIPKEVIEAYMKQ
jgi:hypothetical protein